MTTFKCLNYALCFHFLTYPLSDPHLIIPKGPESAKRYVRTHDTFLTLFHVRVQDMSRRKQRNPKAIVNTGEEELKMEPQEESDEDSRELRCEIFPWTIES